MSNETFSNNGATQLNGAIDSSQTTITIDSSATLPPHSSGFFRIKIDDEIIRCEVNPAASTELINCERGAESTAAASHSDDAPVTHVLTAGAIAEIRVPQGGSDGQVVTYDDGSIVWATPSGGSVAINDLGDATDTGSVNLSGYAFTIQSESQDAFVVTSTMGAPDVSLPAVNVTIGADTGTCTINSDYVYFYGDNVSIGSGSGYVGVYGSTTQKQVVATALSDGEISSLSFSSTPTQAECEALRDKCEALADNLAAVIQALYNFGLLTPS